MSRFDPQKLLERFDQRLHDYASEMEKLRAAGVSEHRIQALYPPDDNYTVRLSQALGDSKVHAKVRRVFQPSASVLDMPEIFYELRHDGLGMRITVSKGLTSTLVAQLKRDHPVAYKEDNSAHAFASMIYIIPAVLPSLKSNPDWEFSQLSVGGRLEIKTKDFFWRVNELLLVLG